MNHLEYIGVGVEPILSDSMVVGEEGLVDFILLFLLLLPGGALVGFEIVFPIQVALVHHHGHGAVSDKVGSLAHVARFDVR